MNTSTESKSDWEVIQEIKQYEKDSFLSEIVRLFTYNHLIEWTNGGFAELFSVYIQSPEFKRLDEQRKTDFLQAQFAIYDMFKLIDDVSENYSVGKYS
ncbi:hypothetical protein [Empedobacter sp.]|uniref:hypothetical protein n=1 Tax=Empedobacter sp. TaxID=1927715 RepID=UPI00289E753D|nr:hypothetical protein [Empedobacter sp.]